MGQLHQSAMDFKLSRKPPSPFNGCVGALDGISVKIGKRIEVPSAEFYCRKGFYALSLQALVDAHYKFIFMSCLFPGSTHDLISYRASALWPYVELRNELHPDFWIVGDEAFAATEVFMTLYPSSELNDDKSAFNYFLSKLRNHVEQAFGMLVAKRPIFEAPLRYRVRKSISIVSITMRLHNFCVDN